MKSSLPPFLPPTSHPKKHQQQTKQHLMNIPQLTCVGPNEN
jgi:hypothetical protein